MIKVIAFDLYGVLITDVVNSDIIKHTKLLYPNITTCIATNSSIGIKNFIYNNFDYNLIDKIFSSGELNISKPNKEFFLKILEYYNIKPNELLVIDDKNSNIDSANSLGIKTVKVNSDTIILEEIKKHF